MQSRWGFWLGWLEAACDRHPRRVERATIALAAALVLAIAWTFAATVLHHTRSMGLPLDDSYIYLTYAKQIGRGQPFTYFPGGGYSAGSTSLLWPVVLAPFWTLGARGHALVWVSFVVSAALHAVTAIGVSRIVRAIAGDLAAVLATVIVLAIAPLAFAALSGMEVAFAAALVVTTIRLLIDAPRTGAPSRRLAACLAATSLSRPEAMLIVIGIVGASALVRLRRRELGAAAWWLAPLAAPAAWLVANQLAAGHWFPNTGVAKSHFYLPGFDWTYWRAAVWEASGRMLRRLFWDAASPLVWPRVFAVAWLAGAIRVALWARRERRYLAGAVIVASPLALLGAVIASSGQWSFQNYRYIAPAFPLLAICVGCALGPRHPGADPGQGRGGRRIHALVASLAVAGFVRAALPGLVADARLYAQGAMDTNTQVVAIGRYLHDKLPDASVVFHDAGAIAYYGDGKICDLLGLVTNHQAGVANHGPGARFEFLEDLPPAERFTHFAYYPGWLGTTELFGEVLLHTPLRPAFEPRRLAGDGDMQVIVASWDHVGTGERPLTDHAGWAMVDRIDVANLASEAAHGWSGALGRRRLGDPTARWSVIGREAGARGLVLDGGRTIRGGSERFAIAIDPARPVRLVLRTGGARSYPYHEAIDHPVPLAIVDDAGRELARETLPAPTLDGAFAEVVFALPPGSPSVLHTRASAPYRAFHWFVLQPE
ncbi:MAG TPA: hypothetical protein VFK02_28780 [Kofleriaceae bacterium]|nr:hypothetical protein [Kofleriaceae bacterium]